MRAAIDLKMFVTQLRLEIAQGFRAPAVAVQAGEQFAPGTRVWRKAAVEQPHDVPHWHIEIQRAGCRRAGFAPEGGVSR
ncbi:hypothetical protein WS69_00105 [Burkholderia sp. BDU5]|nr:hypothetical protein WS69_00105 [Burkholderia sp. BDU5]